MYQCGENLDQRIEVRQPTVEALETQHPSSHVVLLSNNSTV